MICPQCKAKNQHFKINSYVTEDSKITGRPIDDLLVTTWECAVCEHTFVTRERRAIIGYDAR